MEKDREEFLMDLAIVIYGMPVEDIAKELITLSNQESKGDTYE
ncbi:hypothetical protein [Sporanaerobium hydrogeniformans]|nr:hypothetical protein [Sporanaerobium hydrogeniformans]